MNSRFFAAALSCLLLFLSSLAASASKAEPSYPATQTTDAQYSKFPQPVTTYADTPGLPLRQQIEARAKANPFNVVATVIFILAILHTFLAVFFQKLAHKAEHEHEHQNPTPPGGKPSVSFKATIYEYLGEVEAIFSLWAIPLLLAAFYYYGWEQVRRFVAMDANFTEPFFVVVIMTIAATKPVVYLAESVMERVARLGGGTPAAWWCTVLVIAPLLGSVITEPAAMTVGALILAKKFYDLNPSAWLKYATLGLLFVNVSIGGVLTNFAAPPVLMVAGLERWNWSSAYMFQHFGLKAILAVVVNVSLYFILFRKQLKSLQPLSSNGNGTTSSIPKWIVLVHVLAIAWTVFVLHYPALFVAGWLFFLGFCQATANYQDPIRLRGPLMVGFFLAGLVLHGKLQAWWLEPILRSDLSTWGLHIGAGVLTSFNDNALITYLASQVPNLSEEAKYAIMSGAVAGGGLTVIANAPNPAGQSLLKSYFKDGAVSPLFLIFAALVPTVIASLCFMLLPH